MITEGMVIGILILIGLIFLALKQYKVLIVLAIIPVSYLLIISSFSPDQVNISSIKGIINGIYLYASWIGTKAISLWDVGSNTASIVGNAIKGNFTMG